jgi:hypothetical protein
MQRRLGNVVILEYIGQGLGGRRLGDNRHIHNLRRAECASRIIRVVEEMMASKPSCSITHPQAEGPGCALHDIGERHRACVGCPPTRNDTHS